MNAHFFGAKRAYYATLRIARPALARFGLTPARFDLLTVLRKSYRHRAWQSELRKALGVAAATVARMLRSLEDIGLVRRARNIFEKRQVDVTLSDAGLSRLNAIHAADLDGHVGLVVDTALAERWFAESHVLRAKDEAEAVLMALRSTFGDRATLYYPWHPDD